MIAVKTIIAFNCIGPRDNQEDYIIAPSGLSNRLFVLCDGMGGHGHGEIASKTVAESIFRYLSDVNPIEYTAGHLQEAVDYALGNLTTADVFSDDKRMGTTLVVVAINRMSVLIGHIGDSRCYHFDRLRRISFRTKDHSSVQEAVDAEILTEDEARNNPRKNILTRCIMSGNENIKIDVDKVFIEDDDVLLLCTDGVTDALSDAQIRSILMNRSVDEGAEIIKSECEFASHDNFSGIIVELSQDEVNAPLSTSVEEHFDISAEAVNVKYCVFCGNKINHTSTFCPNCGRFCGKSQYNSTYNTKKPELYYKNILTSIIKCERASGLLLFLKKAAPYLYTAAGVAAGLLIADVLGAWDHQNTTPSEPIHLKNDGIDEMTVTNFITEACEIPDSCAADDSILYKDELLNQYHEFLKEIHKKDGLSDRKF